MDLRGCVASLTQRALPRILPCCTILVALVNRALQPCETYGSTVATPHALPPLLEISQSARARSYSLVDEKQAINISAGNLYGHLDTPFDLTFAKP